MLKQCSNTPPPVLPPNYPTGSYMFKVNNRTHKV